jgi:hypothetical protein
MEKRKALEINSVNASSGSLDYGRTPNSIARKFIQEWSLQLENECATIPYRCDDWICQSSRILVV